jgi:predicted membrane-bound spermidine synthase
MGTTFPLMMDVIRKRESGSSSSFSYLYLANVIGAMAGTLLTANFFIELFGFRGTLAIAGVTNLLIALTAWLVLGETSSESMASTAETRAPSAPTRLLRSRSWSFVLLFATGFISMSLEVIWTRAFTPVLNTTIYAFALVLAVYLAGTALGSAWYRRHLQSGETIDHSTLLAGLMLSAFWTVLITDPRLHLQTFGVEIGIFPFCLLLGYFTPQLIDEMSGGDPQVAGRAYAVNVVGCILGPLVASYGLLPMGGVKNSLILLAVPFVLFWMVASRARTFRWKIPVGASALAMGLAASLFAISHEEKYPDGIVRRDPTATVISTGQGMNKHLYVNGQGITMLATTTKCMAHLPLAYLGHPPQKVLAICFGMGTTFRSLMSWGVPTTAVELVPSVRDAFGYYYADASALLADPRGHVIIDDGRRFLRRSNDLFDVITIDPPPPVEAAGSSLLYSKEMYVVLQKRLSPDGILQQWYPGGENSPEAKAIARSLTESFPYVRVFRSLKGEGLHFLATHHPLENVNAATLVSRMPEKARKDLMEWEPGTPELIFSTIANQELSMTSVLGPHPRLITDDRPYNEYYWLRRTLLKASAKFHRDAGSYSL